MSAGKTGTTDGENDAWFVGFTNDVTVAVWVGYDNADGKRRTLGGGQTGASVAVPIFEPIVQAAWADQSPRTALSGPSPEARKDLVAVRGDHARRRGGAGGKGGVEYLRRDRNGQARDTRYRAGVARGRRRPREYERYDRDDRLRALVALGRSSSSWAAAAHGAGNSSSRTVPAAAAAGYGYQQQQQQPRGGYG